MQLFLCDVAEVAPGSMRAFDVRGRSIVLIRSVDEWYAIRNVCPHQGAHLCDGTIGGTNLPSGVSEYRWGREGEVLRCPWHGWEFDIVTGRTLHDPKHARVKAYKVSVIDERVYLDDDGSAPASSTSLKPSGGASA